MGAVLVEGASPGRLGNDARRTKFNNCCNPGEKCLQGESRTAVPCAIPRWLGTFRKYKPLVEFLLIGKSEGSYSDFQLKPAITWWNREINRCVKGDLSHVQIMHMDEIAPGFGENAEKLRLNMPGSRKNDGPKSRRDYYLFACKLSDCLQNPGKAENKLWLEVLRYRYRKGQLDSLQENMVEASYPGFCTEKAIMAEKCRQFSENLERRLSDLDNPTNQNWLRNYSAMARNGKIHPDYIELMNRRGLLEKKMSFASFIKKYVEFKQAHGEPRQRAGAPAAELRLARYACKLRKIISSDPDFPAWKMKQLYEAGFSTDTDWERK